MIKSRWDFEKNTCEHLNKENLSHSECLIPKFKRCKDCIRPINFHKVCQIQYENDLADFEEWYFRQTENDENNKTITLSYF